MERDFIYTALDFPTWKETEKFLEVNEFHGIPVKVGMELFYREGPAVIEKLKRRNHSIFLDLKLHDIPTTVKRAMRNLSELGVDIVNVHALGGSQMIQAANEGLANGSYPTRLIAVTILTSMDKEVLNNELLIPGDIIENAVYFAKFSQNNGADGVVCSVHEAKQIKENCGKDFLTVTPGIRLADSESNDQKRISTPKFATENGSDILVIGRSITQAENPRLAYEKALRECNI
ncbi:orotidine-5'-phosphate decarboxylase [Oceanobacillus halophilus]|uniref:Orotidine 5'-phosphate decarboxylase n=1 Tax=Oceanobacillus halophilus TaxID=930130 RepID=A0A495ABM2_9BACI|nr:orotidine-5'-phosphate decarboxylase [Oceanobacillus halophilus]RKQ37421.1 orotidine-5'-phosphate decarboxylase [Oceanobacillus halophilus]